MTNDEKQLLLKDLSARLPYGVKITFRHNGFRWDWPQTLDEITKCDDGEYAVNGWGIHGIKPYLRSISSMTEEEINEYENFIVNEKDDLIRFCNELIFYNTHHIDYRGLIPMGLALEAPENMYKID